MTRKELSETLGLSCVEKYFLAWLKPYYNLVNLYGNSFIGFQKIIQDFKDGAEYERYSGIPRLQTVAEKYGIVARHYEKLDCLEAVRRIQEGNERELILMRTDPAFFIGMKRSPWRKDHYIFVSNTLNWINEYPLAEGVFSREEFLRAYGGAIIRFDFTGQGVLPPDENTGEIQMQQFSEIPELDLKNYGDAIGILRITRKRLALYYEQNDKVRNLLQQEIAALEKQYFSAHRMLLARKNDKDLKNAIKKNLLEIQSYEKKLKEILS